MRGAGRLAAYGLALFASSWPAAAEPASPHVRSSSTLSAWFGDDDVLHDDARSPAPDIADRAGYDLLADGRVTRRAGRESLGELALALASPGYFQRIDTSAELRLWLDFTGLLARGSDAPAFQDASSFVRVSYRAREAPRWTLDLTAYPIDADRVRLGYLRDLSWGGSDARRRESVFPGLLGTTPAVTLGLESPQAACWLGLKTARLEETPERGPSVARTNYGALAGLSARSGWVRVELGLGGFEQGRFAAAVARGARRLLIGSSARITLARGPQAPRAPGLFALPRALSEAGEGALRPGWAISLEASVLAQRLATTGLGVRIFPELGSALVASFAWEEAWIAGLAEYRDALFVLRNAPGFTVSQAFPAGSRSGPELGAVVELGYRVRALHLAPSVELGARWPAWVLTPAGRVLTLQGPGEYSTLGPGQGARPRLGARAGIELEASELLDSLGWVDYEVDPNAGDSPGPEPRSQRRLGLGIGLRARF